MTPGLVLLGLAWGVGAGAGLGVIDDQVVVAGTPWAGLRWSPDAGGPPLEIALQGPLRLDTDAGRLREADWDERADFGRLLRFVRYGQAEDPVSGRAGLLTDFTLGEGTIVRRYHNGTDDDHHRVGATVQIQGRPGVVRVFSDRLLDRPLFGAYAAWRFGPTGGLAGAEIGLTGAADLGAPGADGEPDPLQIYGLHGAVDLIRGERWDLAPYVDLNRVDAGDPGLHLGTRLTHRVARRWTVSGRAEFQWLGEGYLPSLFDTAWLIRRWSVPGGIGAVPAALGGRGAVEVEYAEALLVGAEYADADAPGRADLSAWMLLPLDTVEAALFYARRDPPNRLDVFDPTGSLAAVSVRVPLDAYWSLSGYLARAWRDADGAQSAVGRVARTEGGVLIEVAAERR